MASNYPASLDNFTNPTVSDYLNSTTVPHATQHSDLNDAVENLQAKVGIDSSADTDSIDYKVADAASRITTLEAGATANAIVAYADLSARTAANPSPSEGDVSWQEDTNRFDIYNGSVWVAVGGGTYIDYSGSMTFTNFTLGNGTINYAHYTQIGDFVHFAGQVTLGSTSSVTGNVGGSLPITSDVRERGAGNCEFIDSGVGAYGGAAHANGTSLSIYCLEETGGFVKNQTVISTRPFTWTTSDSFSWTVVYKAA